MSKPIHNAELQILLAKKYLSGEGSYRSLTAVHFRHFVALSSGNHLLFEPLVSTVSMYSENDCGMKCGRKNTPEQTAVRGVFCCLYDNSETAKSQVFSTVKI